jgi:hypothetical protein
VSTRPSLPGADLLFGQRRTAAPAAAPAAPAPEPEAPKHVKITVYLPEALLADIDEYRAALRREGIRVDRGRLLREAWRTVHQVDPSHATLDEALRGEER